jgi:hypothetical protein
LVGKIARQRIVKTNQAAGVAALSVRFQNGYISSGGFGAANYWGGNPALSNVDIALINGGNNDFTRADQIFFARHRLSSRPSGYTWHHVGGPGSTNLELVRTAVHGSVSHSGPAAPLRAIRSAGGSVLGCLGPISMIVGAAADEADARKLRSAILNGELILTDGGLVRWGEDISAPAPVSPPARQPWRRAPNGVYGPSVGWRYDHSERQWVPVEPGIPLADRLWVFDGLTNGWVPNLYRGIRPSPPPAVGSAPSSADAGLDSPDDWGSNYYIR